MERPICAGCFVSLTCRAHSKCYCLKSEVAPVGFWLSHFPHRPGERGKGFVPAAGDCLGVTASRTLSVYARRLHLVCHCSSYGGT